MVAVSLIAGIGLLLAGILAIAFGIPVKEFSFGNTLILVGAVSACSGILMIGLWMVIRELRGIARRLDFGTVFESRAATIRSPAALTAALGDQASEDAGFPFGRDQSATEPGHAEPAAPSSAPPPWHEEAASRDRGRGDAPAVPEPAEAAPAVKPKRNLLFSSSSRKERERAQTRTGDAPAADPAAAPAAAPAPAESSEPPPATFDDAWPKPERSRPLDPAARRSARAPSTFAEPNAGSASADRPPPVSRSEDPPPVTVLKSGVVDGMAYSLYSDGSIEAQMPEGMMRFASIDELRAHLDHRS
jgi:murein DD-endopeptidase MepM/ murein hydrolase activator NlpD